MSAPDTELLLAFFKALGDEQRLKITGLLALGDRSLAELAGALRLKEHAVARHVARLLEVGVVAEVGGESRRYRLDGEALRAMNRALLACAPAPHLASQAADAWERQVLGNFVDGERLKDVPASRKKRQVILAWLASRFEPDRRYPEREVNEIIKRSHLDSAWLRRELVDNGFLQREAGVYWRVETTERNRDYSD